MHSNQLTGSIPLSFVNLVLIDDFYFYNTSLCEPDTPEFLAWKATVNDWRGTGIICGDVIDIDFRPDIEGYSFENWRSIDLTDFMFTDLIRMFGFEAVCLSYSDYHCIVKPIAALFEGVFHVALAGGLCLGMSVTSLRFMTGVDTYPGFDKTFDLNKYSLVSINWNGQSYYDFTRRNISYFHILQVVYPVKEERENSFLLDPSQNFDNILSAFTGSEQNYVTVGICKPGRKECHALTPFSILEKGNNIYWVKVYDSNYPGDNNRYIVFDNSNESWSYDAGKLGIYSGNSQSDTMSMTSLSNYALQPECPWCESTINSSPEKQVWYGGVGDVLITDSQLRRLGNHNGIYYDEIPDASGIPIDGGLGIENEPIYFLPLTDEYSITVTGPQINEEGVSSLTTFGPGYAVALDNIYVDSTTSDEVFISSDGTSISYQSNQSKEVDFNLIFDTTDASWQVETNQVDLNSGLAQLITADKTLKLVELENSQGAPGVYNLHIKRVSDAGYEFFYFNDISLPTSATHYVHFDGWQNTGNVQIDVDNNGDGDIDDTLFLENQVKIIYLPVITK